MSYEKKLRCEFGKQLPIHLFITIVILESVGIILNYSIRKSLRSLSHIQ